jgi:hypothetical protein
MSGAFAFPSPQQLTDAACAQTGLSDFGQGDFREGLERYLDSLQNELRLGEAAAAQYLAGITRRLVNRLEVEAWYREHREVDDVKVGPPLSITGLPRTGTTALANILSLDDQFRSLRSWEQSKPCPPPVLGEDERDPRRLASLAAQERMAKERPELMALHLWDPDTTEEDVELLGLSFRAQQFALPLPKYHAWWRDADLTATYAYQKRVIKLLQSRRPPDRWLFKAPAHNYHLEAYFKAYPDARVIITHRDPAKAVPSAVSFVSALYPKDIPPDDARTGPLRAEHLRVGAERAMAARARIGEDRFFDVHHTEFVRDPFGVLERIYDFVGLEFRPHIRRKMEAWHAKNRSGAHGAHSYTAEQFGLSKPQLRADYAAYIERYGVVLEG